MVYNISPQYAVVAQWSSPVEWKGLKNYIVAIKARTENRKKTVKQQCLPQKSSQYGELRPTSF